MNTPLAFALGTVALVIAASGCSYSPNEQDGHQEPTLATYEVTLSTSQVVVPFDTGAASASQLISLSVKCKGDNLPADCDQNTPGWTVRMPTAANSFLTVSIDDPTKPATTATVTLNIAAYLQQYGSDPSSLSAHWFMVGFIPSSIPKGLKLGGFPDVVISPYVSTATGPRQEQPPDKPRLTVMPNPAFALIQGLTLKSQNVTNLISYSGPSTDISLISITGPGAAQFSVLSPSLPYHFEAPGNSVYLVVQFQVPQEDTARHLAYLTVTLANNQSSNLSLIGQRQDF